MFTYRRHVHFYETDLMGIVHHANYLRFLEEARVAWGHHHGFIDFSDPQTAAHFAVLETRVRHLRPAMFGDELVIEMEAKAKGARIHFQYRVKKGDETVCVGETHHVPLDKSLRPLKLEKEVRNRLEKFVWTETWLSNS